MYLVLGARYMSTLSSCPEWLQIAKDFERMAVSELYRSNQWETCRNLPSKWMWLILL